MSRPYSDPFERASGQTGEKQENLKTSLPTKEICVVVQDGIEGRIIERARSGDLC